MAEIVYKVREKIEECAKKEDRSISWIGRQLGMSKQMSHYFFKKDKYSLEDLLMVAELINAKIEDLYKVDKHG